MIPPFHVQLFGTFLVLVDDVPVTTLEVPRVQSLLAYLLLHHTAPQARLHLAALFWPESSDAQALTNLRTVLHHLRQALPGADAFLAIDRHTIQWRPAPAASWTLDVLEFERALTRASEAEQHQDRASARQALEQAVECYQGDLLPSCYDEWILPERDRLHQAFLQALEQLAELLEQERDYTAALAVAQRLLHQDPLREEAYRQLMRLYAVRGDRAAALRIYHTCVSALERELGVEPGQATRAAYERLLHAQEPDERIAELPAQRGLTSLVGRKQEWRQLQAAWRRASAGNMHLLVLAGEAGIGKTCLAEELLTWVSRQGRNVAAARCYAAEGELAYAPVAVWLRSPALHTALLKLPALWLTEIARIVPEVLVERPDLPLPAPLVESWQRHRLFEALARAILVTRQPLLLVLDDLHWCDQAALEWLHYLLRFDPQAPVLLVGTLRPEELAGSPPLRSALLALQRDQQVTEISLGPLDADETTALAEQVARRPLDPAAVTTLYQETEGNPLFVVEAVRAGLLEQRAGDEPARKYALSLTPTVQAVLGMRLAQLSPQAQEVANLAAVIGRAFSFAVLAQASQQDEEALVRALDELWQRHLVREQGTDAYDFSHEQLRQAAYATLSTTRQRFLHRQVAQALETLYADALEQISGQLAVHYERAGIPARAIMYYQQAGELAQRTYANSEAMAAFRRALSLLETASLGAARQMWRREVITQLQERLGDLLALSSELSAARNCYQAALSQHPDSIGQARLQCKIGNTWETQRKNEAALAAYELAEQLLGARPRDEEESWWQQWIEIQRNRLQVYYWLAQTDQMQALLERTQPMIAEHGTPSQRAAFFQSLYLLAIRQHRYLVSDEVLGYAEAELAAAQEGGDDVEVAWAHLDLGGAYLVRNQLDQAEAHLQAALHVGERTGHLMLQGMGETFLILVWRRRGQGEAVKAQLSRAEAVASKTQNAEFLGMVQANLAWLAWREGKHADALIHGNQALEWWQHTAVVYHMQWAALWPLLAAALAQQHLAEAMAQARRLLAPDQHSLPDDMTTLLTAAIQAWDGEQPAMAAHYLQQTLPLAQARGYL